MTKPKKTHREVKNPTISSRYLADFMAASQQRKRTIIRDCKYRSIARMMQHKHARERISRFISSPELNLAWLQEQADDLREAIADDDFDRSVLDNNADYIDRFIKMQPNLILPDADYKWSPENEFTQINGVKINTDILFKAQRVTKTNKVRVGAGTIRYAKGKPLGAEVAEWQSAFMFGLCKDGASDGGATAEEKLCLTVCAQSGIAHPAPSDSTKRFNNMKAACATIAERWPNIQPPPNAVL
ncbi:MAG: hypothetical protein AAGJ29_00870 [Pseudomonadota bacterium]